MAQAKAQKARFEEAEQFLTNCEGISVRKDRGVLRVWVEYEHPGQRREASYHPRNRYWKAQGEKRKRGARDAEHFLCQFAEHTIRPDERFGELGPTPEVLVARYERQRHWYREGHDSATTAAPPDSERTHAQLPRRVQAGSDVEEVPARPRQKRATASGENGPRDAATPDLRRLPGLPHEDYAVALVNRLRQSGLLSDMGAPSWALYLRKECKSGRKIDHQAIHLLAHICEWHAFHPSRPTSPRFTGPSLNLSTSYLCRYLELGSTTVKDIVQRLERYGVIRRERELRGSDFTTGGGAIRHLMLVAERLDEITHPVEVDPATGVMSREARPEIRPSYLELVPAAYPIGTLEPQGTTSRRVTGRRKMRPLQPSETAVRSDAFHFSGRPLDALEEGELSGYLETPDDAQRTLTLPAHTTKYEWNAPGEAYATPRRAVSTAQTYAENARRTHALDLLLMDRVAAARQDYDSLWHGRNPLSFELQSIPADLTDALQLRMRKLAERRVREELRAAWSIVSGLPEIAIRDAVYDVGGRKKTTHHHLVRAAALTAGRLTEPDWSDKASMNQYTARVNQIIRLIGKPGFNDMVRVDEMQDSGALRWTLVEVVSDGLTMQSLKRRLSLLIQYTQQQQRGRSRSATLRSRTIDQDYMRKYVAMLWGRSGISVDLGNMARAKKVAACADAFAYAAGQPVFSLDNFTGHLYREVKKGREFSDDRHAFWDTLFFLACRADPIGSKHEDD